MKKIVHKRIMIAVLIIALLLGGCAGGIYLFINSKLSKINHVSLPSNDKEIGIDTTKSNLSKEKENNYINILLLGVDSRDPKTDPGRSDATMILTIDKKHKKIKVTSLLRDMVMDGLTGEGPMAGQNQDRLNHAYAYGGPLLSLKTVNENFNLNMRDFVKVDFAGLEKIIDSVGGISINVSSTELPSANSYIKEVAAIEKKSPDLIKEPGMQNLSGIQALGYSRIRYVGNGDFERTERQRTVLDELFKKLSAKGLTDIYGIVDNVLPYVSTSLDKSDILSLSSYVVTNKVTTFEQNRLPIQGTYTIDYSINDVYFVVWNKGDNKAKNVDELQKFIYEEDAGE